MNSRRFLVGASTTLFLGLITLGLFQYQLSHSPQILEFVEERDTKPILDLFKSDWYWLVASKDFSPAYMLRTRSYNEDPKYKGKMQLKVLRDKENFFGFTAYFEESRDNWRILFLAINPEHRGKRLGEKILRYAIDDMKKRFKAKKIELLTRIDNVRAQSLYKRMGFVVTHNDSEFVYFDYLR